MKIYLCLIFLHFSQKTLSQSLESGIVTYSRTENWVSIFSKLSYLSDEDKTRLINSSNKIEPNKDILKLVFLPNKSIYYYANNINKDDFYIKFDFKESYFAKVEDFHGTQFFLHDSLKLPRWKIYNEIKDVNGHICTKASTKDTIKNLLITAWFAQDIPLPYGPELYHGLPGLILELNYNEGDVIISATNVEFGDVTNKLYEPKFVKVKPISLKDYSGLMLKYINDRRKMKQNPFWGVRL